MDARRLMQQHVTWQLGDGSVCGAFGQPWHGFWTQVNPSSARHRRLSVSYFLNQAGQWDNGKLIEEFGFAIALYISLSIKPPVLNSTRADRFIFTYTRNGQFTLKKAYHLVAPEVAPPNFQPDLLRLIWHTKGLLPRIRLFLWKAMHNGLPLGDLIGRRISNATRPCALCGFHAETLQHERVVSFWKGNSSVRSTLCAIKQSESLTLPSSHLPSLPSPYRPRRPFFPFFFRLRPSLPSLSVHFFFPHARVLSFQHLLAPFSSLVLLYCLALISPYPLLSFTQLLLYLLSTCQIAFLLLQTDLEEKRHGKDMVNSGHHDHHADLILLLFGSN